MTSDKGGRQVKKNEIGRDAMQGEAKRLEQVSIRPRVWVADGFLTDKEADDILAAVPAEDSEAARRLAAKSDQTGFSFEWPIDGSDLMEDIRKRLNGILGIDNQLPGTFRFRHYQPDQGHPPHVDCYEVDGAVLMFTALMHLEDSEAGGETLFPFAEEGPLSIAPRKGRLVVWGNYRPEGRPDAASNHEGARLVQGSKTTLTWFVYAPPSAASHTPGMGRFSQTPTGPGQRLFYLDDGVPSETTEVMAEACRERGVQFVNVNVRQFNFSAASPVLAGDMIYRAAVSLDAIKAEQHLFVDGAATLYREADGVFFDSGAARPLFERAGVPMPRGVYCHTTNRDRLREYAEFVGGFPLIAKFPGGSGGVNIVLVESMQGLFSLMDHAHYNGRTPYLTAYVPDAEHWRFVVVGDEVVAAYLNQPQQDDFRTYDAERPEDYRVPEDAEMIASALAAVRALRLELGGVDILLHPSGRHYVLEANFPCYFATAQRNGQFDIAGAIVDWLQKKAAHLVEAGAYETLV